MNYESINNTFGTAFEFREMERIKGLPIYMTAGRSFCEATDGELRFALVHVAESEQFGVAALERQLREFEEKTNMPVAFCYDHLSRYQRDALVQRRIPFVAVGQQMYLPFLGVALSNRFKAGVEESMEQMTPIAQSLFLYMLYECKGVAVTKSQAADALQVSRMSMTRAARQLEAMGVLVQESRGRECYIHTNQTGRDLFDQARPYLINPVRSAQTVQRTSETDAMPLAGESALSERSMLGTPRITCLAASGPETNAIALVQVDARWSDLKDIVRLEIWRYDPMRFAQNGVVDPVSLYLSLADNPDERVEGALEEMLEEYAW